MPTKHYLVRLKKESGLIPLSTSEKSERFLSSRPRSLRLKRKLERTGFLLMESEEDAQRLLEGHPDVAYIEEEKYWAPAAAGSDAPSSQAAAPWMRDVLGLQEDNPPTSVSADGVATQVAVVDTGLAHAHPYFESGLAVNLLEKNGASGVDDDNNGYIDDVYGANVVRRDGSLTESTTDHGTHVAGLVKAVRDQAAVRYPTAGRVKILGVRFIDGSGAGSTSSAILGLEYAAARGARVVNASWGAKGEEAYSQALYDAFLSLYEQDIFSVVAAGNAEGGFANDNDRLPYFPANFNIPGLVSVASVTPSYAFGGFSGSDLSGFSNYGRESVHLAAPGSYQDASGIDSGVYSAFSRYSSGGNLYIRKKGTSMAAPVIAGIAAVVRALNPKLTAYEVRELLIQSSRAEGLPVIAGGAVDAADAFDRAVRAVSQGQKPPADAKQYSSSPGRKLSDDEVDTVGGCGAISGTSGPGNPFGGNGLGLVTLLFAMMALVRRPRSARV